jgi:glycosyltransferase involved in cell wall biosynthesis
MFKDARRKMGEQPMKLSLCMIVRDEEATLPACLNSVQGLVDEMVVVDTGSTDRTLAIAKSYGAKVYQFTWCDDFAAARNHSLQYAQGDWVLILDADEILQPEIIIPLQQAIQQPQSLVVNLLRHEIQAAQAPYSLISRLFRRHPQIQFGRPYHELIDDSVLEILQQEPDWQILELPGVAIHHTGYQSSAIAQRQKFDRARRVMEGYLKAHPDDAYICNKLGALYADGGDRARGLELLQRGLDSPQLEPTVRYELHYHLGEVYRSLGDGDRAGPQFQAAIEQPVSSRLKLGAYINWGCLELDRHQPQLAQGLFAQAVAIAPDFALGHFNLGMALKTLGNLEAAIDHYYQAIRLNPTYAEAYQSLGVALLKGGRVTASLESFRQAIDLHTQQGSPEADRLREGLQAMGLLSG